VIPRLSIASICRDLPGPENASGGIFVLRRLAGMSRQATVNTIQPIPWFPVLKPLSRFAREPSHDVAELTISHAPMFYIPGIFKSLDSLWLYRAIKGQLATLHRTKGVSLVDAHFGYPEGVGALLAARKIGIPVVVTLRGFEVEYLAKPVIGRQIRHLLRNVDGCICVSHFLKDVALKNGARESTTRVIHNAIDKSLFFSGDRESARSSLGLPPEVPIVISVGHLISRKRQHVLIDAFSDVLRRLPDARLLLVGGKSFEQHYPRQLKQQVADLGMEKAVSFLGNVDASRVGEYLRAADVFALGTQREGCCNAVLEALACGLPVVTTPVGDNTWFVKDGQNGFIVPVDDSKAMAKAVMRSLEGKVWDARRIASELNVGDWDDVARKVMKFFDEVVQTVSEKSNSSGA